MKIIATANTIAASTRFLFETPLSTAAILAAIAELGCQNADVLLVVEWERAVHLAERQARRQLFAVTPFPAGSPAYPRDASRREKNDALVHLPPQRQNVARRGWEATGVDRGVTQGSISSAT